VHAHWLVEDATWLNGLDVFMEKQVPPVEWVNTRMHATALEHMRLHLHPLGFLSKSSRAQAKAKIS
jgi:hypothetical protein